jgi:hypothetical protein
MYETLIQILASFGLQNFDWYRVLYLPAVVIPILVYWHKRIDIPHVGYVIGLGIVAIGGSIGLAGDKPIMMILMGAMIFISTFALRQRLSVGKKKRNFTNEI